MERTRPSPSPRTDADAPPTPASPIRIFDRLVTSRAGLWAVLLALGVAAMSAREAARLLSLDPYPGGPAAALYVAGSFASFALALRASRSRSLRRAAWSAAAVCLAVRLALAYLGPMNYDLKSWTIVAAAVARGDLVYEATSRYNYGPLWASVLGAAASAGARAGLPPVPVFRVVTTLGDALVAAGLYRLARARRDERHAAAAALAFWCNPVPIATSSCHGQFDSFAIAFLVAALAITARTGLSGRLRMLGAAAIAGVGVALKQIVAVFLPAFLGAARRRGVFVAAAACAVFPFALLLLPYYLVAPGPVLRNVVQYSSYTGAWGWLWILGRIGVTVARPELFSYAALIGVSLLAYRTAARGGDPASAARRSVVLFLVLSPGWSLQMLPWPLALGPERRERAAVLAYTVSAGVAYAGFFWTNRTPPLPLLAAFMAAAFWALSFTRGSSGGRAAKEHDLAWH